MNHHPTVSGDVLALNVLITGLVVAALFRLIPF
jgi:hypothetical protein